LIFNVIQTNKKEAFLRMCWAALSPYSLHFAYFGSAAELQIAFIRLSAVRCRNS